MVRKEWNKNKGPNLNFNQSLFNFISSIFWLNSTNSNLRSWIILNDLPSYISNREKNIFHKMLEIISCQIAKHNKSKIILILNSSIISKYSVSNFFQSLNLSNFISSITTFSKIKDKSLMSLYYKIFTNKSINKSNLKEIIENSHGDINQMKILVFMYRLNHNIDQIRKFKKEEENSLRLEHLAGKLLYNKSIFKSRNSFNN